MTKLVAMKWVQWTEDDALFKATDPQHQESPRIQ